MVRISTPHPRATMMLRMRSSTRIPCARHLHAKASTAPRVLVVGGGPVGLAMGYMLDRLYGIPTRIIERQAQPTTHPQAHFLNLRTMEMLHSVMPGFHDQLLEQAAPSELWRDYIYTTGVSKAKEFARIDQFGCDIPRPLHSKQALLDVLSSLSPTQFLHFPQNRFETMLSAFVEQSSGDGGIRIERGVELVDLQFPASSGEAGASKRRPHVTLHHKQTNEIEHVAFDYVIGADGAHSLVRQLCGIEMAGARNLQSIVNVHFTSKTLSSAAREHPGMLYFVFNEHVIGVLIAHDLHNGEWVFQIPFFPPQESIQEDFSVAQCKAIVQHLLPSNNSIPDDDIDILSVGQWQMSARVAKQYDHFDHRVFLVGDAAHQFPPAGGFGMNTGLQDAHNLAWKLAWAIQANGDDNPLPVDPAKLLGSYQRERQHTAKINTQLSLRNVARTMKIPSALNVSHNNAKILEAVVNSAPVKLLPHALQRGAIQQIMALGKKPLALLESSSSSLGERMRRHVQEIVGKRSSLGMLFYHFDIGFSYDTAQWGKEAKMLMLDESLDESARFASSSTDTDSQRAVPTTTPSHVFRQQFRVGGRFPHLWCVDEATSQRVSTVTLSDHVRTTTTAVRFLLVVDKLQWTPHLLDQLDASIWGHVAIVFVADGSLDPMDLDSSSSNSINFQVDTSSSSSSTLWTQFTESHVAALVRPDGHIGALWGKDTTAIDANALASAMRQSISLSG